MSLLKIRKDLDNRHYPLAYTNCDKLLMEALDRFETCPYHTLTDEMIKSIIE